MINDVNVTGNYKPADIVAQFPNYFFKISHTTVSINAKTPRTTVTPLFEHSAPDFQLNLLLLLPILDRS